MGKLRETKNWFHSAGAKKEAKSLWIIFSQYPIRRDLLDSMVEDEVKVCGPFKYLSLFLDEDGIWKVGSRMRDFTLFTLDNKPAVI